jgi:tRNA G18 (ribose-2'-O)-methylase SpoU
LDGAWRAAADVRLTVPMAGAWDGVVDSLNASNAAAVLLFEAVRRRRAASGEAVGSGPVEVS